jgi:four helix bundle protein
MKITKFEDIIAWKKSKELTYSIYSELRNIKDYGFKNQIQRASISIMNNIAEGYERMSNREFKNFLSIAKGSSGEVRSMLHVAKTLNYINDNIFIKLQDEVIEISKILSGLIKSIS